MRADDPRHPRERVKRGRGPVEWIVSRLISVLWIAFFGLVLSLVMEWIGLTFWWPDEGAAHSRRMLIEELQYLERDFNKTLLPCTETHCPISTRPIDLATDMAAGVYRYTGMEWTIQSLIALYANTLGTGLESQSDTVDAKRTYADWFIGVLAQTQAQFGDHLRTGLTPVLTYIEATAYIAQLYGVRLAVVLLSMGAFVLFGLVALVSGLVQRDLRRFGGGVESAWIFHRLTPFLGPCVWLAVIVYLSTPVSLHPNTVFLPAAAAFAVVISKTTARFKKFL